MADHEKDRTEEFWYRGKVTRRRLIGYGAAGAGALGATMLVPGNSRLPLKSRTVDTNDWLAERFEEHVGINLIADPERLRRLDLALLAD